jgi:hypothetical protein
MEKYNPSKKVTTKDGTIMWVWEGKLHNIEEPAVIHPNGRKEYYIHGIKYTEKQWKEAKRNRTGLPFYKQPGMNVRN